VCASYSAVLTFRVTVIANSVGWTKRVVMTTERKLEAVKRIENGEFLRNVAGDFGVGISTVSEWVKSKLEEYSSKLPNGGALQSKKVAKKKSSNQSIRFFFV
jgi:transposase